MGRWLPIDLVDDLDVPWKLTDDSNGDEIMLIRHGTPLNVPIANVINDFIQQQLLTRRLRHALALWNNNAQRLVPDARSNDTLPAEIVHLAEQFQPSDEQRHQCDQVTTD